MLFRSRADISQRVGDDRLQVERLKHLDRLRSQATITWRNDELKNAYDKALGERRKSAGL